MSMNFSSGFLVNHTPKTALLDRNVNL